MFSQVIPIPLLLNLITPRAKVSAIYCRATLPACYPPAPRGFQVISVSNGLVTLENLQTHTHATVDRSACHSFRVFVTWEI